MKKSGSLTYFYVVLSCCSMAGASMGLCFYGSGLFYDALATGLNMSVAQASLTTTYLLGFMALTALLMPRLLKRMPLKFLLGAGGILAAGGALLMAFGFSPYWMYFCACLEGIGAGMCGMVPATTLINNWIYSRNSWTTSLTFACSALLGALFAPFLGVCITALGWRMGFVVQAVLIALFMLPGILLPIAYSPARLGMVPYGSMEQEKEEDSQNLKNAKGTFFYIALIAVFAAALLGIPLHFSTYVTSLGDQLALSASMLSYAMIGNVFFKLIGGWIGEKTDAAATTFVLDVIAAAATIGLMVCMKWNTPAALKVLAFFFGSAYGLAELSAPLLIRARYGARKYASHYSVMNFLSMMTTAVSIAVVGLLYDKAGSFWPVLITALVLEVLIGLLLYFLLPMANLTVLKKAGILSETRMANIFADDASDQQTAAEELKIEEFYEPVHNDSSNQKELQKEDLADLVIEVKDNPEGAIPDFSSSPAAEKTEKAQSSAQKAETENS